MKFIKKLVLFSIVSFAFVTFNVMAATITFLGIQFGGISGYSTGVRQKTINNQIPQRMETLRADHRINARLYHRVGSASQLISTITIEPRNSTTWLNQNFSNNSRFIGDYNINLRKSSLIGNTRYWGIWVYDPF